MVVPLEEKHLDTVAELQVKTFAHSPIGRMGKRFLTDFLYPSLFTDPYFIGLVCLQDERIAGFLIATSRRDGFISRVAFRHLARLIKTLLHSCLENPRFFPVYLKTFFYFCKHLFVGDGFDGKENWGEFISIVIQPSIRRPAGPMEKNEKPANQLLIRGMELMKEKKCEKFVTFIEPKNFLSEVFFSHFGFRFFKDAAFFGLKTRAFVRELP
ncbi:MAG: hypothetical protein PHV34_13820 [Verrucomicrobiae bacterium]|nr:hypothetical protein [Verrucomicrobiae bacterium]